MQNENFSIEQMIEIEPRLIDVKNYVILKNEQAKTEEIYWHNIWPIVKKMQYDCIGWDAKNERLATIECWDKWCGYLYSLSMDCL